MSKKYIESTYDFYLCCEEEEYEDKCEELYEIIDKIKELGFQVKNVG